MAVNVVSVGKGALTLLSLVFGSIVLTVLGFAFFFTVTTTVYASVVRADQASPVVMTLRDILGSFSTISAVENMNMGNIALAAVYVLVVVLIVLVDAALKEAIEALRQRAKLPLTDTVHHYNQNSYDIALARASSTTYPRMKQD